VKAALAAIGLCNQTRRTKGQSAIYECRIKELLGDWMLRRMPEPVILPAFGKDKPSGI